MNTKSDTPTAEDLRAEGLQIALDAAVDTRLIEEVLTIRDEAAERRAARWLDAHERCGLSTHELGRIAGVHHTQISKALRKLRDES